MWQYLDSGIRKARKRHKCFFCAETILIGEEYNFRTGVDLDGIYTMKMHPECLKATEDWTDDDYEVFSGDVLKRGTCELR